MKGSNEILLVSIFTPLNALMVPKGRVSEKLLCFDSSFLAFRWWNACNQSIYHLPQLFFHSNSNKTASVLPRWTNVGMESVRGISSVYFIQIRYSYVTSDRLTSPHTVRDKVESQDEKSPRSWRENVFRPRTNIDIDVSRPSFQETVLNVYATVLSYKS